MKQRNDLGLDGRTRDGLPIQVKRSDNIGRHVIDNFQAACKRFDNQFFEKQIAGSPYKPMEVLKINELSKAKVGLHLAGLWHLTSGVQ